MDLSWKHLHGSVVQLLEAAREEGVDDRRLALAMRALDARGAPPRDLAAQGPLLRQLRWLLLGRMPMVDPGASVAIKLGLTMAELGEQGLDQVLTLAWTCEEAEHERLAALPARDRSDHFYNRALAFGERHDLLSAVADVSAALEAWPEDIQALANRGTWLLQLEDVEGALADWSLAVELDPGYLLGLFKLGGLRLGLGDEGGRPLLERALALAPEDWPFAPQARAWLS